MDLKDLQDRMKILSQNTFSTAEQRRKRRTVGERGQGGREGKEEREGREASVGEENGEKRGRGERGERRFSKTSVAVILEDDLFYSNVLRWRQRLQWPRRMSSSCLVLAPSGLMWSQWTHGHSEGSEYLGQLGQDEPASG